MSDRSARAWSGRAGTISASCGGTGVSDPGRTIIVSFTAGGPNDLAARIYADGLRRHFGSSGTFVIENRPGGAGVPGTEAALQGDHDGYTLLMGGIAPLAPIRSTIFSADISMRSSATPHW